METMKSMGNKIKDLCKKMLRKAGIELVLVMLHIIDNPTILPLSKDEQEKVFNLSLSGNNVAVPACAGSGKTYTADAIAINCNKRVEFIPFMRELAKAQAEKHAGREHINVVHFHARGKRMLPTDIKVSDMKGDLPIKLIDIATALYGEHGIKVAELVNKAKSEAVGCGFTWDGQLTMEEVSIKYGIFVNSETFDIVDAAEKVLKVSDEMTACVDFSDMLRFPVIHGYRQNLGDALIILDEVQDFTPASWIFVRECLTTPNSHVLMIGDFERQTLMSFTGANAALFDEMAEHFNCERVSLTINRRCSKAVVAAAPFAGDMVALPDAPEGEVGERPTNEVISDICAGKYSDCALLSETNIGLVRVGINLVTNGVPVQMRSKNLDKMILRFAYPYLDTRKTAIGEIAFKVQQDLEQRRMDGAEAEVLSEMQDVQKCIAALETYCLSKGLTKPVWIRKFGRMIPQNPIQGALELLTKSTEGITLMTGHIAKGLEWPTVFHLVGKMRAPEQAWQEHQNNCLAHVIATRAQLNFYTLTGELGNMDDDKNSATPAETVSDSDGEEWDLDMMA